MKSRLFLTPWIVAAAAAFGASGNAIAEPIDAQSSAAALLSPVHTPATLKSSKLEDPRSSLVVVDARASAAALLTGYSPGSETTVSARTTASKSVQVPLDAQAQAAALLSGSRTPAIGEPLGEHPAVLVARKWSARGIDPNTFIVGHPAGLRLINAPPIG